MRTERLTAQWRHLCPLSAISLLVPVGEIFVLVDDSVEVYDQAGTLLRNWAGSGTGEGQFNDPFAIAVDGNGDVYVVDTTNSRVQVFTSAGGVPSAQWGALGWDNGQLGEPVGVLPSTPVECTCPTLTATIFKCSRPTGPDLAEREQGSATGRTELCGHPGSKSAQMAISTSRNSSTTG